MAPSSQGRTQLTRTKRSRWYQLVIYAAICFGAAWYFHAEVTALERSPGGKWGLVGAVGAIGAYSLALGIVRAFGGQSQGVVPVASEDPEWARRMREDVPRASEPVPARRRR